MSCGMKLGIYPRAIIYKDIKKLKGKNDDTTSNLWAVSRF